MKETIKQLLFAISCVALGWMLHSGHAKDMNREKLQSESQNRIEQLDARMNSMLMMMLKDSVSRSNSMLASNEIILNYVPGGSRTNQSGKTDPIRYKLHLVGFQEDVTGKGF